MNSFNMHSFSCISLLVASYIISGIHRTQIPSGHICLTYECDQKRSWCHGMSEVNYPERPLSVCVRGVCEGDGCVCVFVRV